MGRYTMKQLFRLVLSVILFSGYSVQADIYRWVDEETGAVVYSDQPGKDAKRVKLKSVSGYNGRQLPGTVTPQIVKKPPVYKSMTIISPANNSTIRDNAGNVSVSLGINPGLKKGHSIILTFDGKDTRLKSTRLIIKNVARGSHELSARVVDKDGSVQLSSEVSQFNLKRHSILFKQKAINKTP